MGGPGSLLIWQSVDPSPASLRLMPRSLLTEAEVEKTDQRALKEELGLHKRGDRLLSIYGMKPLKRQLKGYNTQTLTTTCK